MSLDANVIPGIEAVLNTLVPATLKSVHVGEQFNVGQTPEAWVLMSSANFPAHQGSDVEASDWVPEVRVLKEYDPDQREAEMELAAIIEPIRAAFRMHTKLAFTTGPNAGLNASGGPSGAGPIAGARVGGAQWLYVAIADVVYRMVVLNVLVTEKQQVTLQAGT